MNLLLQSQGTGGQPRPDSVPHRAMGIKRRWKLIAIALVSIIVVGLAAWTFLSPKTMELQSTSEISNSLFQFAKSTERLSFADSEGNFTFLFGIDYNQSMPLAEPAVISIFASLISESGTSPFLRGVSLSVERASVLVNGQEYPGLKTRQTISGGILIEYLTSFQVNTPGNLTQITARLIVSTIDVNYVGFLPGSEEVIQLNGTVSVS